MSLTPFQAGAVVPAHPLALTASRRLDERRQRALSRYYLEAGAGGLAVGVHTTQFAIHEPRSGLLEPVLSLGAEEARAFGQRSGREVTLIAGALGRIEQAVSEASLAASLSYDAVLLSPVAGLDEDELLARAAAVGDILPVVGFYLQPAVGGRRLSQDFWRRLAALECVVGIKVAPFDRYCTLDVVRGVAASGRAGAISLYTGNDDHIALDLLAAYPLDVAGATIRITFIGGLLGQWAVWTRKAVDLLADARLAHHGDVQARERVLTVDPLLTDANSAIFDAANGFRGCIPGIHDVLVRMGLLEGRWCLDVEEDLSRGQAEEIDRVWAAYPQLRDDEWVAAHRDRWLSG